jgi:hypothetical protein
MLGLLFRRVSFLATVSSYCINLCVADAFLCECYTVPNYVSPERLLPKWLEN